MYSSYCDCGKFVKWLDPPPVLQQQEEDENILSPSPSKQDPPPEEQEKEKQHAWFISRGAEICDVGEGICKFDFFAD